MAFSKRLFIIDGLGALLSAFLLGIILPRFQVLVGIPLYALYILAFIPILYALFDGFCLLARRYLNPIYLSTIALLNIIYCIFSMLLALYHIDQITAFGWAYIIIELAVVFSLALVQFNQSKNLEA